MVGQTMTNPRSRDEALDRLLTETANVIGWDDPDARARLLKAIRDEPRCADHTCTDCYPKDTPMTRPETALKIAKYTVIAWAVLAVVFLAAAMVFGEQLP